MAEEWLWILTHFENEPLYDWGWHATPESRLRSACDPIWEDYLIRLGKATSHQAGPPPIDWRREGYRAEVIDSIEPGWEHYAVYLRDGDHRKLDLDKTLTENGIAQGNTWVVMVREE